MTSSVAVVAAGPVGLGASGAAAAAGASSARRRRPCLPGTHAECAHTRADPLAALRLGYASLHVAVWLDAAGRPRFLRSREVRRDSSRWHRCAMAVPSGGR